MATTVAATKHCKAAIDSLNETGVARTLFLRLLRSCHRIIVVVKRLTIRQHPHPSVTASVSSENVNAACKKRFINGHKLEKMSPSVPFPNPIEHVIIPLIAGLHMSALPQASSLCPEQ